MRHVLRVATRLYGHMLNLYPSRFRAEFAAEMQAVFADALAKATREGVVTLFLLCGRELRDWLAAVLKEHLQERKKKIMGGHIQHRVADDGTSWWAASATAAVFIIPTLYVFLGDVRLPFGVPLITYPGLLVMLLALFIAGLIQGFPRWFLPYVGFLLVVTVFSFLVLLGAWLGPRFTIMPLFAAKIGDEPARLRAQALTSGLIWLSYL